MVAKSFYTLNSKEINENVKREESQKQFTKPGRVIEINGNKEESQKQWQQGRATETKATRKSHTNKCQQP